MEKDIQGYKKLGFGKNPFSNILAENEPKLPQYYIMPPYFNNVLGDADSQSNRLIFGSYGKGKTALRKSIESWLRSNNTRDILAVSYDYFPNITNFKNRHKEILIMHLVQIMKRLTVAILLMINESGIQSLNYVNRLTLRFLIEKFFEPLTLAEKETYCRSVSNLPEHIWLKFKKNSGTVFNWLNNGVNLYLESKVDFKAPDPKPDELPAKRNPRELLQRVYDILEAFGVKTVIILIDNVDQSGYQMQKPLNMFSFLAPLLLNNNFIEINDTSERRQVYGFKFFLPHPDEMKKLLEGASFRFDRVFSNIISWNEKEMKRILEKRLQFFHAKGIHYLAEISEDYELDRKVINLAKNNPRSMLRICNSLIEEYGRSRCKINKIPKKCSDIVLKNFQSSLDFI